MTCNPLHDARYRACCLGAGSQLPYISPSRFLLYLTMWLCRRRFPLFISQDGTPPNQEVAAYAHRCAPCSSCVWAKDASPHVT